MIRALKFEQAIEWHRLVVWIQLRGMNGEALPVIYNLEQAPFVRFKSLDSRMGIEVRRDYYGKTWRCFDENPAGRILPAWDDTPGWDASLADEPEGGA